MNLYYQIDYTLTEVPEDAGYFHAQFRRTRYNETSDFTIIDNVKGKGQYVGIYMAWGLHNNGWWGEGEIKFFMDGDDKFPTICGTGTEDYFAGPTTSTVKDDSPNSAPPTQASVRSFVPTAHTVRRNDSAFTAGISWIRSASTKA